MISRLVKLKGRTRPLRVGALAFATVAAAAGIAACSSGGGSGGSSASSTVKIITWVNPPAVQAINKIDAEFEKKYPNISVKLQTAVNVNGPYETLLQQTVNSGDADIVTANTPLLPLPNKLTRSNETPIQYWVTNGAFAPLNGQSYLSDYTADAKAADTYQGKTYGLVSGEYQEGVFYNKAIFAKYHLSVPTTYNQFLAVCNTLKSHGVQPLYTALGSVGPVYLQFIYYEAMTDLWYPAAPGGNLATGLMSGSIKWTAPQWIQAMNEEKNIAQYLEPNYTGINWESMQGDGDFGKGTAAMELDGSWDLASIHSAVPNLQVGYFPLPFSNTAADNQAYAQNDLTFYLLNSSQNKTAAEKWLAFFSSPSIYSQYVNITGISPSQSSGTYTGFASQVMGQWFGKGVNQTQMYPALSPNNGYYDQEANWPDLQLSVIQGKMSAQQAAQTYEKDWTQ
jgi:raffinose/stachyose/melibiose transport system substrate-binding protein